MRRWWLMRTLIKNLQGKLAGNDPRWLAFGLNMPATNSTPGRPMNVTLQLDARGGLVVQCDTVPLATRYRCRGMILGMDNEYRLLASSKEPVMTARAPQPGQTIQVIIQPVNRNLQGVASEPVTLLVPAVAKTAVATEFPVMPQTGTPRSNGTASNGTVPQNGSRNGAYAEAA